MHVEPIRNMSGWCGVQVKGEVVHTGPIEKDRYRIWIFETPVCMRLAMPHSPFGLLISQRGVQTGWGGFEKLRKTHRIEEDEQEWICIAWIRCVREVPSSTSELITFRMPSIGTAQLRNSGEARHASTTFVINPLDARRIHDSDGHNKRRIIEGGEAGI